MRERYESWTYYVVGFALAILGIFFLYLQEKFSNFLFALGGVFLLIQTVLSTIHLLKSKEKIILFRLLFRLVIGLLLVTSPWLSTALFANLIAIYQMMVGIFLLIHSWIAFSNRLSGRWVSLVDGSLHILFGISVLGNEETFLPSLYSLVGLYLIFLGLSSFRDGLEFDWGKQMTKFRRKRINLPIIVTALVPMFALDKVNQYLNPDTSQSFFLGDKERPVDLEIWVHTARKGFERMGHVDFALDGKIYSYGNHDVESHRLFEAIGDGILMTMPVENYKQSLMADSWRAVFGYGLVLSAEEKGAVQARLDKILSDARDFPLKTEKQKHSYLGGMIKKYGAQAYKFQTGRYKTYFVMTTNCVQLVDDVVAGTGMDILDNHGILTPGAYQTYLEKEFRNPNSRVVSQMVIGKQEN